MKFYQVTIYILALTLSFFAAACFYNVVEGNNTPRPQITIEGESHDKYIGHTIMGEEVWCTIVTHDNTADVATVNTLDYTKLYNGVRVKAVFDGHNFHVVQVESQ